MHHKPNIIDLIWIWMAAEVSAVEISNCPQLKPKLSSWEDPKIKWTQWKQGINMDQNIQDIIVMCDWSCFKHSHKTRHLVFVQLIKICIDVLPERLCSCSSFFFCFSTSFHCIETQSCQISRTAAHERRHFRSRLRHDRVRWRNEEEHQRLWVQREVQRLSDVMPLRQSLNRVHSGGDFSVRTQTWRHLYIHLYTHTDTLITQS